MPGIRILKPGLLTSVQDAGRKGYEHLGIMVGGSMDDFAASWANRLVGNSLSAAVLEITLLGPTFEALDAGWMALAGADLGAMVNGIPWHPGYTRHVVPGDTVSFGRAVFGMRAYIGFAGGLDVQPVLGSRSTDLVAGFGGLEGRALLAGDELRYAGGHVEEAMAPGPTCLVSSVLRVLPASRLEGFSSGTWEKFLGGSYRVDPRSNRVGIRLDGPHILNARMAGDQTSEAIAIGSVEVPPSGELLILTKSRGSIGGYPTLAHVIAADWPVLAQLKLGSAVSFEATDVENAREVLCQQTRALEATLAKPR